MFVVTKSRRGLDRQSVDGMESDHIRARSLPKIESLSRSSRYALLPDPDRDHRLRGTLFRSHGGTSRFVDEDRPDLCAVAILLVPLGSSRSACTSSSPASTSRLQRSLAETIGWPLDLGPASRDRTHCHASDWLFPATLCEQARLRQRPPEGVATAVRTSGPVLTAVACQTLIGVPDLSSHA